MQTPPTHERLVARLIADAQPVRPLWSPRTRLALWLALQTLTLGSSWGFVARGALCVICILGYSAIPWTVLFVAVRRGAPLDAPLVGVCAGAAALLFAAAAVRIACPIDEALHLLTWHAMPVALGTALSGVAGARWLDRWRQA